MKVTFDKIASATKNARVPKEALLGSEIPAKEGQVLAVKIRGQKSTYNTLEDVHGRMIPLNDGDVVAGVLGARRALKGYAGVVPSSVKPGDLLDMLNLGGVIGCCTSANVELGAPLKAEVLGAVLSFPTLGERVGVPASIKQNAVPWAESLEPSAPVVYVAGTCMNAGKTFACGEIIRHLVRSGKRVAAAKLTGVSLLRDTLSMTDLGAFKSLFFGDAGLASTTAEVSVPVAKGILNALNAEDPDCLVVELGDGILGEYGVHEILSDEELMGAGAVHVLCANDPVAAWGAVELYKTKYGKTPDILSGPATDNAVGTDFITQKLGVKAINARLASKKLGMAVAEGLFAGLPSSPAGEGKGGSAYAMNGGSL